MSEPIEFTWIARGVNGHTDAGCGEYQYTSNAAPVEAEEYERVRVLPTELLAINEHMHEQLTKWEQAYIAEHAALTDANMQLADVNDYADYYHTCVRLRVDPDDFEPWYQRNREGNVTNVGTLDVTGAAVFSDSVIDTLVAVIAPRVKALIDEDTQ